MQICTTRIKHQPIQKRRTKLFKLLASIKTRKPREFSSSNEKLQPINARIFLIHNTCRPPIINVQSDVVRKKNSKFYTDTGAEISIIKAKIVQDDVIINTCRARN